MAGLQLQVLSNPSPGPTFVIGNPQLRPKRRRKRVASFTGKRETKRMAHRRHRRNPFVATAHRGKKKRRVGVSLTPADRKDAAHKALKLRKQIRSGKYGAGLTSIMQKRLRALQAQIGGGQRLAHAVRKKGRAFKKSGYKIRHRRVSVEEAARIHAGGRFQPSRKKSGYERWEESLPRRKKRSKRVAKRRRRKAKAAGKKTHPRRRHRKAKRSAPKRQGRSRRRHRKVAAAPAPKKRRRRRAKGRKHSKKYWAGRHHKHHAHVEVGGLRKGRKRRGSIRRGKHKFTYSVHRRNPEGGRMGNQALDFLTAGNKRDAAFILAAAALSEPLAAGALMIPGVGTGLASLNTFLAGINPNLAAAVVPILPTFTLAVALELIGKKTGSKATSDFGRGLVITSIVDFGEAVGAAFSSAAGLSGVSYTPMGAVPRGLGRHRGLHGVSYTPMGAVPRGLGAIPSMRGLTRHDNADFGGENLMTPVT
jgi:hypothetical protein